MKMSMKSIKALILAVIFCAVGIAGYLFYEHRTYKEAVVVSPYVTEVKKLSDYSDVIKGTVNDCNVYIFDSGVEGGTMLICGGAGVQHSGAAVHGEPEGDPGEGDRDRPDQHQRLPGDPHGRSVSPVLQH